tara:strand:+ start:6300 stop:6839 length:540 start_codon:yes stop_codon:yes gene_type:complete
MSSGASLHSSTALVDSGLLFQISTLVITLGVVALLVPRRFGAALFSRVLFAILCCIFVVPFAARCQQKEKWTWMWIKFAVLMTNLAVHWDRLECSTRVFLCSAVPLALYASTVNISSVYGCNVPNGHLLKAFCASTCAYVMIGAARPTGRVADSTTFCTASSAEDVSGPSFSTSKGRST